MAEAKKEVEIFWRLVWGIGLLILCLFLSFSLFSYDWRDISMLQDPPANKNLIGPVGAWLSYALLLLLGVGAYVVPFWCFIVGLILVFNREEIVWPRVVSCSVLALFLALTVELKPSMWETTFHDLNIPYTGGLLGYLLVKCVLIRWLKIGAAIVIFAMIIISLVLLVELSNIIRLWTWARTGIMEYLERIREQKMQGRDRRQVLETEEREIEKKRRRLEKTLKRKEKRARIEAEVESRPDPVPAPPPFEHEEEEPAKRKMFAKKKKKTPNTAPPPEEIPAPSPGRESPYQLPPISLLSEPAAVRKGIEADTGTTSKILTETLAEFGIETEVTNVQRGPVVTRYELLPAPGVRLERISGLSNNLSLALKATSIRVQAPVPGKGVVGIEVPNSTAKMVSLRELIESETWQNTKAKIPLVLGKDVGGHDIIADLADMPHMLVAGATGAGKTVCMNSLLAGMLMARTPDQLKLMLVDPKLVEFTVYNHLPHLVVPVITKAKKVALGLRWAINEMEKRYKLFAKVGVRNIDSFNTRKIEKQEDLFSETAEEERKNDIPATVPYIVIVIDELADLMLADQAEIENCVARLAQLSRAVGIHMILSTQRPSVNVITGTIKANFPARIAFQVAQKVDSRTILDSVGAEKLLGRGDMLFLPPGTARLVRAQGAWTTDEEIIKITEFIKAQGAPEYEMEIKEKIENPAVLADNGGEDDDLLEQAVQIIRETRRASTSSLQRRMRIGYTRAARMMDILEERGLIGPPRGSEPREILIDLDGEIPNNPLGNADDDDSMSEQGS